MMGFQKDLQPKLFYHSINLDERIPTNHILRKMRSQIDFDFIYQEVKDLYGGNGNVSVPPPAILKMMLLLILYNVRSERELMNTLPMRLDWLWFLDYDLDSEVPNHSVLSKARNRWGVEAFQRFFERIVWPCVEAGLVDGSKLFMDSSLVQADASNNSIVKINKEALSAHLVKGFNELESRLEEKEMPDDHQGPKTGPTNKSYHSTTDPDAHPAPAEGRLGQDAKRCSISRSPTRHSHTSASYGAVVCPGNEIWIQAGALAQAVARSDSGISHICHTKHYGAFVV